MSERDKGEREKLCVRDRGREGYVSFSGKILAHIEQLLIGR